MQQRCIGVPGPAVESHHYRFWEGSLHLRSAACFINESREAKRLPQKFPHIAPKIVNGINSQGIYSDIYLMGKIILPVLDLLPTATGNSIKVTKSMICKEPTKRHTLKENLYCSLNCPLPVMKINNGLEVYHCASCSLPA